MWLFIFFLVHLFWSHVNSLLLSLWGRTGFYAMFLEKKLVLKYPDVCVSLFEITAVHMNKASGLSVELFWLNRGDYSKVKYFSEMIWGWQNLEAHLGFRMWWFWKFPSRIWLLGFLSFHLLCKVHCWWAEPESCQPFNSSYGR